MKKEFRDTEYRISSQKLKGQQEIILCLIADLHGKSYGPENIRLLDDVRKKKPHAILIAGDLLTWNIPESLPTALDTAMRLHEISPVYYSLGNHEYRLQLIREGKYRRKDKRAEESAQEYLKYEETLKKAGVHILDNKEEMLMISGNPVRFYGLTIPQECYNKPFPARLDGKQLNELLPERKPEEFSILLAHNPAFGKEYFGWGADLIVSGHFHGGVVRFTRNTGLISPQFRLFPPYCCGDFKEGGQTMIVSCGIGEHAMPVRIHDPRELVTIRLTKG